MCMDTTIAHGVVATLICSCCRGSNQIWWDLTHWYFAAFNKPYNGIQDQIARLFGRWQETAKSMGMSWEFERGPLPRCSSTCLWAISCDFVVSRTFGAKKQEGVAYPWAEMWRMCRYSGPLSIGHGFSEINEGCVHAIFAMGVLALPDNGADALLGVLQKLKVDIFQVPLPTFVLALERCGSLSGQAHMQKVARVLAKTFLDVLDKFILERSDSILKPELPITPRYEYRGGNRQTRHDPRQQVGHNNVDISIQFFFPARYLGKLLFSRQALQYWSGS